MKLFLDTSSLIKLYHNETGTTELEELFIDIDITEVYLSEISKIEFSSTILKKVRTKEITKEEAVITLELFESDFEKYTFISIDSIIIEQSRLFISKYGIEGLRTLDSIQLSTAVYLIKQIDLFLTADKLLKLLFEAEHLPSSIKKL